VVRLPRRELALFAGPTLMAADVSPDPVNQRSTYSVELNTAGGGQIRMSGVAGRQPELDADPPADCLQPATDYCADTGYVAGPPMSEVFYHLHSAAGHPGRVEHLVCCNGLMWAAKWYVASDDTTHTVSLYLEPANRIGMFDLVPATEDNGRRLGQGNRAVAQWLLDLTDSFIGFRNGAVIDVPAATENDPTLIRVAHARIDEANGVWSTLVSAEAADYSIDGWTRDTFDGAAKVNLAASLPAMRDQALHHDAQNLASEVLSARRLADGSIEVRTHEVWIDQTIDDATGDVVGDQSGEIDQSYVLGLLDGGWTVLEIRAPRATGT
jgi:hypothetical protein